MTTKTHPGLIRIVVLIALAIFILIGVRYCHQLQKERAAKRNAANRTVPVVVAPVRKGNMPVYLTGLGSVISTDNVTIKTQVNGRLLRVYFREGQIVKAGQLIAEIDPQPFQAQVTQFEGQLARDQAQLENAKIDLKRYKNLAAEHAAPTQQYDTQIWLVKQLIGTVKSDEGQLANARVNLAYTRVTSPLTGRIGLRLVDPGNFVQTSDATGLVVITAINPITVIFTLPEDNIPQVMEQLIAGKKLSAEAYNRTQNKLLAIGTLLTVDNQVDTTTGTVKLRAIFNNDKFMLFPNQFVNVKLLVNTLNDVAIVPTTAVQRGAQGTFVFLLNNNQTVSVVPVTVKLTEGENTAVIGKIAPGQQLVIEGVDRLNEGTKVSIANNKR